MSTSPSSHQLSLANITSPYCRRANKRTLTFIRSTKCRSIAEVGVYKGSTSIELARFLDGDGFLHLFDYNERVVAVQDRLTAAGYTNTRAYGNTAALMDSYNWEFMKLLQINREPIFDYVYIDGAHSWNTDGLAFLLVDRLLQPGGYVDFDDYKWTMEKSPSLNPQKFPQITELYSSEQIRTPNIKLVVDLLVRRDKRYRQVKRNKIFQKTDS